MEKLWLNQYPTEVPAEIELPCNSLPELLQLSVDRFRMQTAFISMGTEMTYGQLDELSERLACYLQRSGLQKGDRVAVMMPNLLQYPVAVFAILRAGMVVVNVNPLYTPRELEHQLKDSGAAGMIIAENFMDTLEDVLPQTALKLIISTQIGDLLDFPRNHITNLVTKHIRKLVPKWNLPSAVSLPGILKQTEGSRPGAVELGVDDLAFLQYTGGTTGRAKGAELTHGNLIANLTQIKAWLGMTLQEGKETVVTALPMYHIFALTANCLTFMALGGKNLLIANPRDLPAFVEDLKNHPVTVMTGVNTLYQGLLNEPQFLDLNFRNLRIALGGGAAIQSHVADSWHNVTGKPISEAYGLTETSPAAAMNRLDATDWNGSIGLPLPSTEFSLRNDEGKEVGIGEEGELCIRGPQVMRGYWQQPEETKKVFTDDGFLKTGDIAMMDDEGYFRIVDRKKDMIIVSGFNVFPNEIEDVVTRLDSVLECACVGVPDKKSGEAVKLFVVKSNPDLDEEAIISHCRAELTGYKVPKQIEFIDELPKTAVGKVLRKELRKGID